LCRCCVGVVSVLRRCCVDAVVVVVKSRLESHATRGYGDYAIYAIYCSLLVICFLSQGPPAVYMVMVLVYRYWKAKLPVSISYNCVLNYPWVSLLH